MNEEKRPLGIFTGETLRKLLMEHPELPIAFKTDCTEFTGEYDYEYASSVTARIGEILDCYQDFEECMIFSDREDFEEAVREYLRFDFSGDELEDKITAMLAEYEPYWKKCILVTVGN